MPDLALTYPIPKHETWAVQDSTKLVEYMRCPRRYFYQYVLGWKSDKPSNHLVFGQAIHAALETLLLGAMEPKALNDAYERFLAIYRETIPESLDAEYAPKTPANAFEMLVDFLSNHRTMFSGHEVLHTEIAGAVPVSDGSRSMHFKIDAILRDPTDTVYFIDFKTGSRAGSHWRNQWTLSPQMSLYTHVLYSVYPPEKVYGGRVIGLIFKKTGREIVHVPLQKTGTQMQDWHEMNDFYLNVLERDFESLAYESEDDTIMHCFQKRPVACTDFGGCPWLDYCNAWQNPLQQAEQPPYGYRVEFWDPRTKEDEASSVVADGEIKKKGDIKDAGTTPSEE